MKWLAFLVPLLKAILEYFSAQKAKEEATIAKQEAKAQEAENEAIVKADTARTTQLELDLAHPDKLRDGTDPDCRDC